jgi:hypothetical protein
MDESLRRELRARHLYQFSGFDVTNLSMTTLHKSLFGCFHANLNRIKFLLKKQHISEHVVLKVLLKWYHFELVAPNSDSSIKPRITLQQRPVFVYCVTNITQNTYNQL